MGEAWVDKIKREHPLRFGFARWELAVSEWWYGVVHPIKSHANCQHRIDELELKIREQADEHADMVRRRDEWRAKAERG